VTYLLMYLALLVFGYRTWRECTDEKMAAIALSSIAVTLGLMTMSLTDNIFGLMQNQLYFWTLAGLTVAISRLSTLAGCQSASAENHNVALARTSLSSGRKSLPA